MGLGQAGVLGVQGFLADPWEVCLKSVVSCWSELQRDQIKGDLEFFS